MKKMRKKRRIIGLSLSLSPCFPPPPLSAKHMPKSLATKQTGAMPMTSYHGN